MIILKETAGGSIGGKYISSQISHPEQTVSSKVDYVISHNKGKLVTKVSLELVDSGTMHYDLMGIRDGGSGTAIWYYGYILTNSSDLNSITLSIYRLGSGTQTINPVLYFD